MPSYCCRGCTTGPCLQIIENGELLSEAYCISNGNYKAEFIRDIMRPVDIAKTIIDQMGGYTRLNLMIGIEKILATESGVEFSFKGSEIANRCVINLNEMDLYDMKFYKIPHMRIHMRPDQLEMFLKNAELSKTPVAEINGLYHDMLIDVFENNTGLNLQL